MQFKQFKPLKNLVSLLATPFKKKFGKLRWSELALGDL